jgi:hypothetical protein
MSISVRARCCNALLVLALAGCGQESEEPQQTVQVGPAVEAGLKKVDAAKLPKLGEYLHAGEIDVAPPAGWIPKSKSKDFLCAFVREKASPVPAIVVKAASPVVRDFENVTADNVVDFTAALQAALDKEDKKPLESPLPMVIGDHAYARHVKGALISNLPAEVQVLTTIRGGRMYTIELRVRPEEILKYRDEGYAVAAGIKFVKADDKPFEFKPEAAPSTDAPSTPPAEKPAP